MHNPKFNWGLMSLVAEDGKQREMLCIPVRQVGGWLYGINANRVKSEIKEKLLCFQENLHVIIHEHLTGKLTMERMQYFEKQIESLQKQLTAQKELTDRLCTIILDGQITKRLEDNLASAGGKALAGKRWSKQDRERARQEMLN